LEDWDWEAAERDFLKAIELDPDYVVAHQWYAEFLTAMGRHDESIAESVRAVELEPTSSLQVRGLANSYLQAGRVAEALDQLQKADELEYSHPSTMNSLTELYWINGMQEDAIVAGYRWDERWGRFFELLADSKPDEALASLDSLPVGEFNEQLRFNAYVLAGKKQEALKFLEELHARRYMTLPTIITGAIIEPIAEEPRLVELRRGMGL
jgi:tetratricopeptide (TPR) repeat protein